MRFRASEGKAKTTVADFSHANAQSSGDDCEGDYVRAVRRCILQRRADRRAARQRAQILGDMARSVGGDGLPIVLDGKNRCGLVEQIAQRLHLTNAVLHAAGKLVVHSRAPPYQAAASSGASTAGGRWASASERSAS
jgi:hypothetical protein